MSSRWLYIQVHGRKPARSAPIARRQTGPARSWKYKAWIRTLPCAACGTTVSIEAAHTTIELEQDTEGAWSRSDKSVVMFTLADRGGMSLKASDYSCIPACTDCHTMAPDSYHRGRATFEQRVEAAQGCTVRELVQRLNHDWFAYSRLVK